MEHAEHACRKKGLFGEKKKNYFLVDHDLIKCHKQIESQRLRLTCVPISTYLLISAMVNTQMNYSKHFIRQNHEKAL